MTELARLDEVEEVEDRTVLSLLQRSNGRISRELKSVEEKREEIRRGIPVPDSQIHKLETIDRLSKAVRKVRKDNARISRLLASLSDRADELRGELGDLRRRREQAQTEYTTAIQRRDHLTDLRSKVVPDAQFRELEKTLARETAQLRKIREDIERLEKAIPLVMSQKEPLEKGVRETTEQIPSIRERIKVLDERLARLSAKAIEKEAVDQLESEVGSLKEKREKLVADSGVLTPKAAQLKAEADKTASVIEAYVQKNEKDEAKISAYEDEIRRMDVDMSEEAIAEMRKALSAAEAELETKSDSFKTVKSEYDELLTANQAFKATIDDVESKTRRLKARMSIKSLMKKE